MGWGGVCKVIITSNPTAVKVVLSCIKVVVGDLTIMQLLSKLVFLMVCPFNDS